MPAHILTQFVFLWFSIFFSGVCTDSWETSNTSIKHTEDPISILHNAAFCGRGQGSPLLSLEMFSSVNIFNTKQIGFKGQQCSPAVFGVIGDK